MAVRIARWQSGLRYEGFFRNGKARLLSKGKHVTVIGVVCQWCKWY